MQLIIEPGGVVRCLYGEAIDLEALGRPTISRASQVEPDEQGRWIADLGAVGGPRLGPFDRRSEALAAEEAWLEQHWLAHSPPDGAGTIEVLRRTWAVVSEQGWNPGQHLIGQLTECRCRGIVFWVREACDKRTRFNVSSNERRGEKCKGPSRSRQALELCCPEEHWDRIAALVHQADPLRRPVLRNRRFTEAWIERQWQNGPLGWSPAERQALPDPVPLSE